MSDFGTVRDRWERIKHLFAEVVAQPRSQRGRVLANACPDDAAMRHEVEALVASYDEAGDLLERGPSVMSALIRAGIPPPARVRHLAPGHRLGPYEIVETIGAGGMGQVYRARDTRLHRDVALKVLPGAIVDDPLRYARFLQEARAASAIEHPHIAVIHEIGEADGITFIAMELLLGETLGDVLARGALTPVRAIELATEIGEGLVRAHGRGIVHRDLKPSNLMITEDGHAKIIDFGVAKLIELRGTPDGTTQNQTDTGIVLGTASYMSPEQARGDDVDQRSDVFSLGIVLFEMLSGYPPFHRNTRIDTMHAILHEPAPRLPSSIGDGSADLQRIVDRCLAKRPDERYQEMRDLIVDLRTAHRRLDASPLRGVGSPSARSAMPALRPRILWYSAAAVLVTGLAAALFALRRLPLPTTDRAGWVQLTNVDSATQPALSPDGRMLAFIRGSGTFQREGQLYLKPLPDGQAFPITNDAREKMAPVFSPDGTRIAYTVNSEDDPWATWIVPTLRGEPRPWLHNASGLTWVGPRQLLFSEFKRGIHVAIVTANDSRTDSRDVYVPADELGRASHSCRSPDGRSVLIVEMDARGSIPCRLAPFDGSSAGARVGPGDAQCTAAAWSPDGRWMYFTANRSDGFHIWRQRFPDGEPEQVTSGPTEEEGIAIASDGRSAITSVGLRQRSTWIHDATGERQLSLEGFAFWPLLSSDARKLCYRVTRTSATGQTPSELWVADVATAGIERLLPGLMVSTVDLSANDRIVAAVPEADGTSSLWLDWLDGREPPRRIGNIRGDNPRFVSNDEIVYREAGSRSVLARVHEDGTGRRTLAAVSTNVFGAVSPDGQWLSVWVSEGASTHSLSLLSTTDAARKPVFDSAFPSRLRWSRDGSRLYLSMQTGEASAFAFGRTYIIPLRRGDILPPMPVEGFRSEDELARIPGVQILPYGDVAPGRTVDLFAFSRTSITRNLYRIPLP
jgi:serine/threonine protein kinase/dipeptidyl aminopeptidase/acylaminoacyl peptidase